MKSVKPGFTCSLHRYQVKHECFSEFPVDGSAAKIGVYLIFNKADGKGYVGGSTDSIAKRVSCHFSFLRNRAHSNSHLQEAWTCFGAYNFAFKILELLEKGSKEEIERSEEKWIRELQTWKREFGYNIDIGSSEKSEETRKKLAEATRRRPKKSHCVRGHPLSGENLLIRKNGWGRCLTCKREYGRIATRKLRANKKQKEQ